MTEQNRYDYVIYKICSDECGEFYIGSTRNMVQRRRNHKSSCNVLNNSAYNTKKYQNIRDNGGWENWRMVPLELMENSTKFEAECREEVVRTELNAKMNTNRASCGGITREEYDRLYREEHKEQKNKYDKLYREEHREQINTQKRENFDCQCGGKYTRTHKASHLRSKKHQLYLENET